MRVDLIELLRCPVTHEVAPLITVAHARRGDRLRNGTLGCPVCGAEYELREGIAYFGQPPVGEREANAPAPDVLRLAALLGLTQPGARVGLCGAYGAAGEGLELATESSCVLVNASAPEGALLDQIEVDAQQALPIERGALAGLAVDTPNLALLSDAGRVVRRGGRIVAPISASVPAGCRELARDSTEWVAEVESVEPAAMAGEMVSLRRGQTR